MRNHGIESSKTNGSAIIINDIIQVKISLIEQTFFAKIDGRREQQ